jgi:hypothetical protein
MNSLSGESEMNNMAQSPCLVRNISIFDSNPDFGAFVQGMSESVK